MLEIALRAALGNQPTFAATLSIGLIAMVGRRTRRAPTAPFGLRHTKRRIYTQILTDLRQHDLRRSISVGRYALLGATKPCTTACRQFTGGVPVGQGDCGFSGPRVRLRAWLNRSELGWAHSSTIASAAPKRGAVGRTIGRRLEIAAFYFLGSLLHCLFARDYEGSSTYRWTNDFSASWFLPY